jgi:glycosyltransferase involved in cell wall biosynthesis
MQTGGDRLGRVRLEAIDTRGQGSALWSIPLTMLAVLRIWCAALLGKVALVHVNMGDRGSAVRKGMLILLVRLAGVPIVLHLHAAELMHHYQMAPPPLRWLMRLPFRTATCCIVIGNLWRDWLINDLGIRTEKIEVVYNGVPVPLVSRAHSSSAENAIFKFLFLGNLLERKGLSDLLHSLALLLKENASWIMTIAGGGDLERYKTLAKELGIFSYTNFVGWVDEDQARQMLREADALVLPSYDEGLPLVILEALGCGTPVVATAVGSIPEVLDDGRTVLFVRPGDRLGIAKKLLLLIKEPLLRQQLSDEGLALYRKRFQIDRFIDSLFDVYRRQCGITIEKADTKTVA